MAYIFSLKTNNRCKRSAKCEFRYIVAILCSLVCVLSFLMVLLLIGKRCKAVLPYLELLTCDFNWFLYFFLFFDISANALAHLME